MLNGLFSGNYKIIADAWEMPVEEFASGAGEMWKITAKESGGFINAQILGTAFRPQMNIYITVAKINFKEDVIYMMYVWKGENLRDARELEMPDKVFVWENNNIFFAPNNNKKILLEDGSLKIVSEMGVVEAKKIDN